MENIKKVDRFITVMLLLVCMALIIFKIRERFLIWNLFLAWIPMKCAIYFYRLHYRNDKKFEVVSVLNFLVWLFFFPNAFYVVTDFIHISRYKFYYANPNYGVFPNEPSLIYSFDGKIWAVFFLISLSAFIACVMGSFSLYLIQEVIKEKFSKLVSWFIVVFISGLCGYALYIGRFIRFNSWDVVTQPSILIKFFFENLDRQAFLYSFSFALFSMFIYLCFYIFIYVGKNISR